MKMTVIPLLSHFTSTDDLDITALQKIGASNI